MDKLSAVAKLFCLATMDKGFLALLLAAAVLAQVVAVAHAGSIEMEPRLWQHELKKTYCQLIDRQRIYKLEQLDIYCAGKVAFFDDHVSCNSDRVKLLCFLKCACLQISFIMTLEKN